MTSAKSATKKWTTVANEGQFSTLEQKDPAARSLSGVKLHSKFSPKAGRAHSLGAAELNLVAGGLIPDNSFFDRP
jgi:hypothetical protein